MPAPNSDLTPATDPTSETGESEFWLSEPEKMEDGEGDWGFAIYAQKDVWIATLTYCDQEAARAGHEAIIPPLRGVVFIATAES